MATKATAADWRWVEQVTRPIILSGVQPDYLDAIAARLNEAGIQEAVQRRDLGPVINLLLRWSALQRFGAARR